MTKAALEKAVQTAADNAQKPNIGWGALEALGGLVCVANLPAGLLMGLSGALSVFLGIAIFILLVLDPLTTLPSAAWVIGAYAMFAGFVLIGLGLKLRRA